MEDLPPGQIKEVKIRKGSNDYRDVIEKSSVKDLPPGWITEAKVAKRKLGTHKRAKKKREEMSSVLRKMRASAVGDKKK
ncbi:hypothetical protein JHK82_048386 [Glycine max]|nr:hypothetical protein JHK82_048386 [Glycine max]